MAKRRYVWARARLDALNAALEAVQACTDQVVSLCSPLPDIGYSPDAYRNTVFFWLPDTNAGIVWLATHMSDVPGEWATKIAKKLEYAAFRARTPARECLDCRVLFLPSFGWDEAGYPPDCCPACVARRIALLGPEQLVRSGLDPRAIFQPTPA